MRAESGECMLLWYLSLVECIGRPRGLHHFQQFCKFCFLFLPVLFQSVLRHFSLGILAVVGVLLATGEFLLKITALATVHVGLARDIWHTDTDNKFGLVNTATSSILVLKLCIFHNSR